MITQELFLIASIASLVIGPICYVIARGNLAAVRALDIVVILSLAVLAIGLLVSEIIDHAGLVVLVPFFIGLFIPLLIEHFFNKHKPEAEAVLFLLVIIGIALHALIDGVTLALGNNHTVSYSVVIHRIPIGLIIWRMFLEKKRFALFAFLSIAVATILGYYLGVQVIQRVSHEHVVFLEAFYLGFLLHIVADILRR